MILVTRATGKTGANVVEQLIERGFPVRAMARRRDVRSERLGTLGAEIVVGNSLDLQSIHRVIHGLGGDTCRTCPGALVTSIRLRALVLKHWAKCGRSSGTGQF